MTGKLTSLEVIFLSICSQVPVAIITSLVLSQVTTNYILVFITIIIITIPIGYVVMWFADKVKQ